MVPVARRLLNAEIKRTRNLLRISQQEQWDASGASANPADTGGKGGTGSVFGRKVGGERGGAGRFAPSSLSTLQLYKPYSHQPAAVTRRGLYSLAVFTSTLVAACSVLKLLARHDRLFISLSPHFAAAQNEEWGVTFSSSSPSCLPAPLNLIVLAFHKFGSSLFLGLPAPFCRGLSHAEDRGLYLGVNILLTTMCLGPIFLWTTFMGNIIRYQELDDTALGLAHAVNSPLPLRDSSSSSSGKEGNGSGNGNGMDENGITTSFRTVIDSGGEVHVAGRVHIEAARRILESISLEDEYRS